LIFIERRKYKREPCSKPIEFLKITGRKEAINSGLAIDESDAGVGLQTDFQLISGQPVIFREKDDEECIKYGIVCWSCKLNGLFRSGVRYIFK
jgi:hypothetical protein